MKETSPFHPDALRFDPKATSALSTTMGLHFRLESAQAVSRVFADDSLARQ
jgi:hypothetical protein